MSLPYVREVKALVRIHPNLHGLPTASFHHMQRLNAGSVSGTALPMKPPSVQSPFAQRRCYLRWGDIHCLLRGRYSSVIAPMDSCAKPIWLSPPSATASFEESGQVATSPCCQRALPDVISANPSSDAWSHTPAVPQSASTCFFFCGIGLPPRRKGVGSRSFSRTRLSTRSDFGAADISYVQASKFACLPDRSYRCNTAAGQPRLLLPGRTCFVTSTRTGYANRPNTGN